MNGEARALRVVSEKDGRGRYEIPFKGPATIVAILAEPGGLEDLADFSAVRAVLSDWRQDLFDSAWLTRTATVRKDRAGGRSAARLRALLHFDHIRLPCLAHTTLRSTTAFFELLGQLRQGLIKVRHQSVVGNLKDRCFLVFVDRNNNFRILHTGEMLNST